MRTNTEPLVVPALHSFLSGLIDYAGLYPPAQLPLHEAMKHYYDYLRSPDRWMLGHFVIGVGQLAPLTAILNEHPYLLDVEPLSLAVVGQGGATEEDFLDNCREDAAAIQAFLEAHPNRVHVAQVELKPPAQTAAAAVTQLLQNTKAVFSLPIYYELSLGENWEEQLDAAATGIAEFGPGAGLKLRTGGLVPEAFPSVSQVAAVLTACLDAKIPLKCTAGLHHPIRHYRDEVQAKMHGFINVFGAGMLVYDDNLSSSQLNLVISDEHADHFVFDERGFHWQVYEVKADQVAAARQSLFISFGSCSFDDPLNDMRALGWL
ncbi:MAG: hypothetical protein IPL78_19940 [Chloroflexi bacterium]|nr:hypothetical protein [Chloroflexota bacterium]